MKPEFERYIAAVKMANAKSKGSGDLNKFDHVAKDYHEEGFDEIAEQISSLEQSYFVRKHHEEILQDARKYDD